NLPMIKTRMAAGKVSVLVYLQGQDEAVETGTLSFIENIVDTATGTIRLKAIFDNRADKLWPGQFVRVVAPLDASANSSVVRVAAVHTRQDGSFGFVVKQDMTVEARPVVTGQTIERGIVIEKGWNEGENVVATGQLRLFPGSRIQIKTNSSTF